MSTPAPTPEWMDKAAQTLAVLKANPVLWAELREQVGEFFAAHPEVEDTAQTRDLMTVIVFRRLTGEQPTEQETKAA